MNNSFSTFCSAADREITLLDVKLNKDNTLSLTYQLETLETIEHIHIPKLVLPINKHGVIIGYRATPYGWEKGFHYADIGFGEMQLVPDEKGNAWTVKVIEHKTKEMTLKEIEKKLGHKVKIVSEKGKSK